MPASKVGTGLSTIDNSSDARKSDFLKAGKMACSDKVKSMANEADKEARCQNMTLNFSMPQCRCYGAKPRDRNFCVHRPSTTQEFSKSHNKLAPNTDSQLNPPSFQEYTFGSVRHQPRLGSHDRATRKTSTVRPISTPLLLRLRMYIGPTSYLEQGVPGGEWPYC